MKRLVCSVCYQDVARTRIVTKDHRVLEAIEPHECPGVPVTEVPLAEAEKKIDPDISKAFEAFDKPSVQNLDKAKESELDPGDKRPLEFTKKETVDHVRPNNMPLAKDLVGSGE